MFKVTFVALDGARQEVDVADGESLMNTALDNRIPGIDGDCGGECACGTCHIHVDAQWLNRVPPAGDSENSMLNFAENRDERSRLGCQIRMSEELDGLVVHLPSAQH